MFVLSLSDLNLLGRKLELYELVSSQFSALMLRVLKAVTNPKSVLLFQAVNR